jgi:hypothetical protein
VATAAPALLQLRLWWDGDLLRELLDQPHCRQVELGDRHRSTVLLRAQACTSNNGTKATPTLSADLFGDWREEIIWRTTDGRELRIYTTTIPTPHRLTTLMHDPQYRLAVAWQNTAYNQPPHPGFASTKPSRCRRARRSNSRLSPALPERIRSGWVSPQRIDRPSQGSTVPRTTMSSTVTVSLRRRPGG